MKQQMISFDSEGRSRNFSLPIGREDRENTGRHQNNALKAGDCNRQSLQNALGNLLWQDFICSDPSNSFLQKSF